MQVTEEMINAVMMAGIPEVHWRSDVRAVLEVALKDVPDVEPFAFAGWPSAPVYLHSCGTVMDADPAMRGVEGSIWSDIEAGDCDCESGAPWLRIYVEKQEKA